MATFLSFVSACRLHQRPWRSLRHKIPADMRLLDEFLLSFFQWDGFTMHFPCTHLSPASWSRICCRSWSVCGRYQVPTGERFRNVVMALTPSNGASSYSHPVFVPVFPPVDGRQKCFLILSFAPIGQTFTARYISSAPRRWQNLFRAWWPKAPARPGGYGLMCMGSDFMLLF